MLVEREHTQEIAQLRAAKAMLFRGCEASIKYKKRLKEEQMAYRFQVDEQLCINCGICMDLCPVHCLDMTRPAGDGEKASQRELSSPIPGEQAFRDWMMLSPVQTAPCIGCQICVQECPTHAIEIANEARPITYARRGPISSLPSENGWQPLDAY